MAPIPQVSARRAGGAVLWGLMSFSASYIPHLAGRATSPETFPCFDDVHMRRGRAAGHPDDSRSRRPPNFAPRC